MRTVTVHDAFVPTDCPSQPALPAVSVEAGTRWVEAYRAVTVEHGRYVQGGGCTSVGAAGGFLQGGGFGSWSKKYGTGAAGLLEAEVVTADGRLLIANACQNADLFWALRGGGGGTYGVVTRATLRTHELPSYFGLLVGTIAATSDEAFQELIEHFLLFYDSALDNEHWGEQVRVTGDNTLELALAFQGITAGDAMMVWRPFRAWIDAHPDRFQLGFRALDMPGTKMWDAEYLRQNFAPGVRLDPRPGEPAGQYWWAGDESQVSAYVYAYQSRWIPADRFSADNAPAFAATLFAASRHWSVSLHVNKGQAGAAADALALDRETSMNPAVYQAAALAIISADGRGFPGLAGSEPDATEAAAAKAKVDAAATLLRDATPNAGTYVNEADYFEPDWQQTFWGDNYERLLEIKHKYDPDGFFTCHHCVGSE
jgi:FAD/FMN-containing dehydrogenase